MQASPSPWQRALPVVAVLAALLGLGALLWQPTERESDPGEADGSASLSPETQTPDTQNSNTRNQEPGDSPSGPLRETIDPVTPRNPKPPAQQREVLPNSLPEERVQWLSSGLRIPMAYAFLRSNQNPETVRRADREGWVDLPGWQPKLRLQVARPYHKDLLQPLLGRAAHAERLSEIFGPHLPISVLPEERWAAGHHITALLQAPEAGQIGEARLEPAKVFAAVVTASGEFWPVRPLDLEFVEDLWVVRVEEAQRYLDPDPLAWLCVQIRGTEHHFAQTWSLAQLRAGTIRTAKTLSTGTLEITHEGGEFFGELVQQQELHNVQFHKPGLLPELPHSAVSGWLACPDPVLWKSGGSQSARLEHVPLGAWEVRAMLENSTSLDQTVRIQEPEATRWNVFSRLNSMGAQDIHPPFEFRYYRPSREELWESTHLSLVWGPMGNLFSGGFLNPPNAEGEQDFSGPWRVAHPVETDFHWSLLHTDEATGIWLEDYVQVRGGSPPSQYAPSAPLGKLNSRIRGVRLVKRPSTDWEGPVEITFVAAEHRNGGFRVRRKTVSFEWPSHAGRSLSLPHGDLLFTHWFATSPSGQGAFGSLTVQAGKRGGVPYIDPSMESGWSALLTTRMGRTKYDQPVSVQTYPPRPGTSGKATWSSTWKAAAGMSILPEAFPTLEVGPALYGMVLLQAEGMPRGIGLRWPGAYDRTLLVPDGARVIEVRVQDGIR